MLSYRHAFHAGNHADVLKHFVLLELIHYLNQKDKPYWYVDTHAGAGLYSLTEGYAMQNAEFRTGISRLWDHRSLPEALMRYVALVKTFNPDGMLKMYPGSPLVAYKALRVDDKMRLFELHSTDIKLLQKNADALGLIASKQAQIQSTDGFAGLKSVLPPPSRRALVLIDPSYEDKKDYINVITALQDSLRRFVTGMYAIWYPCLQRGEVPRLVKDLKALPAKSWLRVELTVQEPSLDGFGMHGSGMFILNPPWTLAKTLQDVMPYLTEALALDDGAGFILEHEEV